MRLLATVSNQDEVQRFSNFLTLQGIENNVEMEIGTDWGSPDYGVSHFKIWIIDEDQIKEAERLYEKFQENPHNATYNFKPAFALPKPESKPKTQTQVGSLTIYLISLCVFLYAWTAFSSPQFESKTNSQTYSPLYTSPVRQLLLFDFPKSYAILDKLVTTYGIDALQSTSNLPPEGRELVQTFKSTPYWEGIYEEALSYLTTGSFLPKAPWFEKIDQGELWRFFSPIFLHGDIFHLLFNMAWLYILGKQLEVQLKGIRYLLFVFIAASFTNTIQYLISGPNFIGFSGVICAMLSFIWLRQKEAPWEGYQIQKSTFNFMMIFIFGMLALQSFAFLLEASTGKTIGTSIANAAHIAGLAIGGVFAKLPFFTKRLS